MTSRNQRKQLAEATLQILKNGSFITPSGKQIDISDLQETAVSNTLVYTPEASDTLLHNRPSTALDRPAALQFCQKTTLEATQDLMEAGHTNVLCLNFASAKNPGGGFLGGSQAQEESLARSTGLYPSLLKAEAYYTTNRQTSDGFYTDYMIYSPGVPLLRHDDGSLVEQPLTCAFLTAPAVNASVVRPRTPARLPEIETVMKRRIEKVLAIALHHGHRSIVLGAWGCGVFQNNPADVARYFNEVIHLGYRNQFHQIVFAVYSKKEAIAAPFREICEPSK
ncbi:MAG: TIGR02452 family protein [Salibacteraceae bacterium]